MKDTIHLKEELIRLRKMAGLTQEGLAEELKLSRQAIGKWESGESLPDLERLLQLSHLYKVTLDSLIKGPTRYNPGGTNGIEQDTILPFLCTAKKQTYAGKGPEKDPSRPGSRDLEYREGCYSYLDSYVGGEQFQGQEVLYAHNQPIWSMVYSGRVLGDSFSGDFLKDCLSQVSPESPFRGPALYQQGDYTYHCSLEGTFHWFNGQEEIYYRNQKIYECRFSGGETR